MTSVVLLMASDLEILFKKLFHLHPFKRVMDEKICKGDLRISNKKIICGCVG